MSFLNRVCAALADRGVRYAVVGGYAVALHGAVRGTVDVDIAVGWNLKNLENAELAMGDIGLQSRLPITAADVFQFRNEYVENRNLTAWNFFNSGDQSQQVDIIITYDLKGKRTKRVETFEGPVIILGKSDLMKMKTQSGRPQDKEDVLALKEIS
jgi:hypothetical protein